MPFDSAPCPNPVSEYNRLLMRQSKWYDVQINTTVTYLFRFEGHDDYQVIPNDYRVVEMSLLLNDWAVEKIWDEIAEENFRHFKRGEVEIRYPSCLLSGADVF